MELTLAWAMENASKISRHSAETDTYVSSGRLRDRERQVTNDHTQLTHVPQ